MNMSNLLTMQCMLVALMMLGYLLMKIGMINEGSKKFLMDLVIYVTLPCSIVRSFIIEFNSEILMNSIRIFLLSIGFCVVAWVLGKFIFPGYEDRRKKVLQYGTICSNSGILGNPVAEGAFGSIGLLYAAIYLIPLRVFMWSVGVTYFTEAPSRKALIKKVVTHPCILAVGIGLVLMFAQWKLPGFIGTTVSSLANANTSMSMLLIGTILCSVPWREMVDRHSLYYCFIRLVVDPAIMYLMCILTGSEGIVTGVSVLLTAMPAASVTAVMAAKYDKDAAFAARIVALSTVLSMISAPAWGLLFV